MISEQPDGIRIFVDDGIGGKTLELDRNGRVTNCFYTDANGTKSKDTLLVTPREVTDKANKILQSSRKSPYFKGRLERAS